MGILDSPDQIINSADQNTNRNKYNWSLCRFDLVVHFSYGRKGHLTPIPRTRTLVKTQPVVSPGRLVNAVSFNTKTRTAGMPCGLAYLRYKAFFQRTALAISTSIAPGWRICHWSGRLWQRRGRIPSSWHHWCCGNCEIASKSNERNT